MSRILIVEDEEAIAELEKDYLELSDYVVDVCTDGTEGLRKAMDDDYDLYILDVMLPGMDGFEICRQIRTEKDAPILMVSARKEDIDKVKGLGLGADDYITKPFSLSVLRARVNTQLRKVAPEPSKDVYEDDTYRLDFHAMQFAYQGTLVELSKTEQKLLRILVENAGRVVKREQLIDAIWTDGAEYVDENALSVAVKRIRDKLDAAECIKTVYGLGYRWERAHE